MSGDGTTHAPWGRAQPVVGSGEFIFAAAGLDHGHIYGMCNGLVEAGAEVRYVFDPDPAKVGEFLKQFPQAQPLRSEQELLEKEDVRLIATATVPCERGPFGFRVMKTGKDFFTDKAPFTTHAQLAEARRVTRETGRKYLVYYSERLHVEAAVYAEQLINEGAIGRVVQVLGLGPHRLNAPSRPAWFFEKARYGGILCDIGSHQFDQFLAFSGATDARVLSAAIANYRHKDYPELEDFGEASLLGNNGATNYIRIDWLTPDASKTWGDGRTFILGTHGYMELRKYINVAAEETGDHLFLVNDRVNEHLRLSGQVGFPFFGRLILDCLHRTEVAMTQEHAFTAARLSLDAQEMALRIE